MPVTTVTDPPGVVATEDRDDRGSELPERRRRARVQLRCPVSFFRVDGREPTRAITLNISSDGFYCLSNTPFVPGQLIGCLLLVSANDPDGRERKVALDCQVRVVRVSNRGIDGMYGIGCKIEDYRFVQV
jgi:hypothetical protein